MIDNQVGSSSHGPHVYPSFSIITQKLVQALEMWLRGRRCKGTTYDSSLTHVGWSDTDIPGSTVTAWYRKDGPRLIILFACSWRASSGLVSLFGGGRRIWEWIGLDWISGDGSITRGLGGNILVLSADWLFDRSALCFRVGHVQRTRWQGHLHISQRPTA